MSEARAVFSDEELTAYLDGEADQALSARIEAALATDPDLNTRLHMLDIPIAEMRRAFSPDTLQAPAMPQNLPDRSQPQLSRSWRSAGFAAMLALGVFAGYALRPAPTEGWMDVVASYQSLYVTETVAGAQQTADVTARVLADFGDSHGLDLSPARSVPGLEFKRAQILGFRGKPLLQMAYLGPDDAPIAFCLTRTKDADRGPRTETLAGLAATSWIKDGIGYLVIGGQDTTAIADMAAALEQGLG